MATKAYYTDEAIDTRPAAPYCFEITKVVRESIRPKQAEDGMSIGQLMDAQLGAIANEGGEVQSVTLQIDEGQWHNIAEAIRRS